MRLAETATRASGAERAKADARAAGQARADARRKAQRQATRDAAARADAALAQREANVTEEDLPAGSRVGSRNFLKENSLVYD